MPTFANFDHVLGQLMRAWLASERRAARKRVGRPLKRLTSSRTLQREAEALAKYSFEHRPISPPPTLRRRDSHLNRTLSLSPKATSTDMSPKSPRTSSIRPKLAFEHFEVFAAIDRRDLDVLGEIRDKAFHLLLEKQVGGGRTPIIYAMRYGEQNQEVVLFLVGAISQWINRLSDADFTKPSTAKLLRLARVNLKFAIDEGLARLQTSLIASFLQTLVMSEGDRWIRDQVTTISFALRAGAEGKSVEASGSAVRRFCTSNLKNADLIADVEDYMANATGDLLMLAAWSMTLAEIEGQNTIPLHYFARDDRVYNAFVERLHLHRDEISSMRNPRLRRQLEAMRTELKGRTLSSRLKIERLGERLEGKGM